MPDYFVVLGQPYKRLREAVARTVTSGGIRYLEDLVKVNFSCTCECRTARFFCYTERKS